MCDPPKQDDASAAARSAPPPAPTTAPAPEGWVRSWTPGLLSPEELEQYWRDGFVVKHGVFTPQELRPVMDAIDRWGGTAGACERCQRPRVGCWPLMQPIAP